MVVATVGGHCIVVALGRCMVFSPYVVALHVVVCTYFAYIIRLHWCCLPVALGSVCPPSATIGKFSVTLSDRCGGRGARMYVIVRFHTCMVSWVRHVDTWLGNRVYAASIFGCVFSVV